jgi:hypothetical protein
VSLRGPLRIAQRNLFEDIGDMAEAKAKVANASRSREFFEAGERDFQAPTLGCLAARDKYQRRGDRCNAAEAPPESGDETA